MNPQIQNGVATGMSMKGGENLQYPPGTGNQAGLAITGQPHHEPTTKVAPQIRYDVKSEMPDKHLQLGFTERGVDGSVPNSHQNAKEVAVVVHSDALQLSPQLSTQAAKGVHHHDRKDVTLHEVKLSDSKGIRKIKQGEDEVRENHKNWQLRQDQEQKRQHEQKRQQQHQHPYRRKHLGMTFEELRMIFTTLDVNNDRSITHREFIRGLKNHPSIAAKLGT
jgi:hypothetical protein